MRTTPEKRPLATTTPGQFSLSVMAMKQHVLPPDNLAPIQRSTQFSDHTTTFAGGVNGASAHNEALTRAQKSIDVMRRAFVRLLGITPRRYRDLADH